jgi:hypothetical protein
LGYGFDVAVLERDRSEGVRGASGVGFRKEDNVCTVYTRSVRLVVIEVIEEFVDCFSDNGPVCSIETWPEAIRARACVSVHLVEGIKNFLVRKWVIKVS